MKPRRAGATQVQGNFLMPDLATMLDAKQALYVLANQIDWAGFERDFESLYKETGRPGLPIRRLVGLLLLKHLFNLSDERVVEQWTLNPYYQYFCGETQFQWGKPCEASELVHFRKRIGPGGGEKILAATVQLHGPQSQHKEVIVDTTAQPKNITFPTDSGLYARVISRCEQIARKLGRGVRGVDRNEIRRLRMMQGGRRTAVGRKKAARATRRLKAIAWQALRQVKRWAGTGFAEELAVCARVLSQQRSDHDKVYSLHEPTVYCMAREKVRTKYEFGSKAAVAVTPQGVVLAAVSFAQNTHDNHTIEPLLEQTQRVAHYRPAVLIADRGFRGRKNFGATELKLPQQDLHILTRWQRAQGRRRYRLRSGVEPRIGHLKSDFRLGRNFLKGIAGDAMNLLLAASASNLRRWCKAASAALLATIAAIVFLCTRSWPEYQPPKQYAF